MTQATSRTIGYTFLDGSTAQIALGVTYTPAPPPVVTLFGNTSRGKSDPASIATVDSTYGPGQVLRSYCTTVLSPPPVVDRKIIGSFKDVHLFSAVTAALYDDLFHWHEIDHHVKAGDITLPQWQANMASCGLTAVCLTGWAFDPKGGIDPADYLVPGVTHLGVDFDGISSATGYHDYTLALANVVAFCKANNLTWGVPEFGANRAANDLTGDVRAQWLVHWAQQFQAAGAQYVCLWEQTAQAGSCFTTPAEVATVRAMLALGPRA